MPYKYVFFGSPEFAEIILRRLARTGIPPLALVCNPDRPVGRKKIIAPPLTKRLVEESGRVDIKILQPEKIDDAFLDELKNIKADFYIVAAYSKILPAKLLAIPPLGVIGVHPSLLPKYRGSTPIQSAILSGEKETGVSLYLMDERMDAGPVIKQQASSIKCQDYSILMRELADLAGDMLIEILPKFAARETNPLPQNETKATYTKKFNNEDAYIPPEDLREAENKGGEKAREIWRKIRALNPEPGVFTLSPSKGGLRRLKLLEAKIENGLLKLTKIQKEGGKAMDI